MADDIAQWLEGLGLGQYAQAFAENDVDAEILPELTDADLKDLGLTLGHRRKLLKAIADQTVAEKPEPSDHESAIPTAEAERRQLTVMFCDLVGSTALSSQLDPEDMRDVLRRYQDVCAEAAERYGGYLAKYMGDGVLVYFGYPTAHEDDAERAFYAGLGIADEVPRLDGDLAVRVGIATGQVVVGDILGRGAAQESAITGETPNLAARLQEIAEPGTVVAAKTTHLLAGALFECVDLGRHPLKGFDAPIQAWRVVRPRRTESRFDAARAHDLTEMIGREDEADLLLRQWRRAKAGDGQMVLISGEPGIGKSRLARALRDSIADDPHIPVRLQCSPFHAASALHPFIDQLERTTGIASGDAPAAKLSKLEAWIDLAEATSPDAAPLLAAMLSIPTEGRYPPLDLTPRRQKDLTLALLADRMPVLARQRPVLYVIEDAHWIDPTSVELLDLFLERVIEAAAMVVVTYRPEFQPPWIGRPRVTLISLGRLDRRDCAVMAETVTGGKALPGELLDHIVARTDGVPLFVEELTKSAIEADWLIAADDGYALSGALPDLAVPATLQDTLEARLERLGPARELAQIGAVIGRTFDHGLMAPLSVLDEDALRAALVRLVGSELVLVRGTPPDASYTFKHGLVQDAAYNSLLRSRRTELHGRIAERLEQLGSAPPEVIAHHFSEAGSIEKGAQYWLSAGQSAFSRSALKEARTHMETGLAVVADLADEPTRRLLEIDLYAALAPVLRTIDGPGSSRAVYERAYELCLQADDSPRQFAVLSGLCIARWARGELAGSLGAAEKLLSLAEDRIDRLIVAHGIIGETLAFMGRFEAALEHLDNAQALYDPGKHAGLATVYAREQGTHLALQRSFTLMARGFADQSIRTIRNATALAKSLDFPWAIVNALAMEMNCLVISGNYSAAFEASLELHRVAGEYDMDQFVAWARIYELVSGSRLRIDGIDLSDSEAALRDFVASGYHILEPWPANALAAAHIDSREFDSALALADRVIGLVDDYQAHIFESEALFLKGDALLGLDPANTAEAEACYAKSIEVANAQSARFWELGAARRLARLWRSQDKADEARDLLTPLYGWFTEGFDTVDLKEAKALLDELS